MNRDANGFEMTLRADCGELGLRHQEAICQCCDGHPLDWLWLGLTAAFYEEQMPLRLPMATYVMRFENETVLGVMRPR